MFSQTSTHPTAKRLDPRTRSARQEAEAEREGARRAKFGAPHNPWEAAGAGSYASSAGGGGGPGGAGGPGGGPRRRRDFLGYYRLMGLDPAGECVRLGACRVCAC